MADLQASRSGSPNRWPGPQRRIGLTGGIATGKSRVTRLLEEQHGLPVLDADLLAREALAPGTAAAHAVLERYGSLDRPSLGRIVFGDPAERHWLEQLVHPLVRQGFESQLTNLAKAPVVVLVIPLLFEVGLEGLCSEVWLVDCDPAQQLARLMGRDRLTAAEAEARIAAQWPAERKRQLADVVLDNSAELAAEPGDLAAKVSQLIGGQPISLPFRAGDT